MRLALLAVLALLFSSCATTATPTPTTTRATTQPTATRPAALPTIAPTQAAAPALSTPAATTGPTTPVRDVVDGDIIKVVIAGRSETVRIIGLDTPEVVDPRKEVQCFGREASAKAKELLAGQSVRLVADPTQDDRDTYQRLLRYVDRADGLDFGLTMIRDGYAHEYTYRIPYERQAAYKAAQAEARAQNRGFWSPSACGGDTTKPADATLKPAATAAPTKPAASTPAPSTVGRSVAPLNKDDCPPSHPIKGNQGSRSTDTWIYHVPGGQSYAATDPEECFASDADASAAGYRKAQR